MTSAHGKKVRLLGTLHLLAMLAVALWWGVYLWRYTPARQAWRAAGIASSRAASGPPPGIAIPLDSVEQAVRLVAGDLAFGAMALLLVGMGTGAYVRRIEIWLEARTSGQAVAFGADGLEGQALLANADRTRKSP